MQINFYMGDQDRHLFHEYIYSRGGYLTPEKWENTTIPIAAAENKIEMEGFCLKIFHEDIFSKSNFSSQEWLTYHRPSKKFHVHGPGMEYLPSRTDGDGIHRGRIYMGLVSTFSFVKPKENDAQAYAKYKDSYKQVENFYGSCCRYIKKNFRKAVFYHGPQSDRLEYGGVPKLQY